MTWFRVTIRHGRPQRYHVVDVEAEDLRDAARQAAAHVPAGDDGHADLLEIRAQPEPAAREYVGEGA
jgi:hypothetical protein